MLPQPARTGEFHEDEGAHDFRYWNPEIRRFVSTVMCSEA
jgi:hypothetical protein